MLLTESARTSEADAAVPVKPFVSGVYERRTPFADDTTQLGSSATQVGPISVTSFGYLRSVLLLVELFDGVNGATTVAAAEDAPWSVIDDIQLHDVAGNHILRLTGYELYLAHKWGGYRSLNDPKSSPVYSAVSVGASGTGNAKFLIRVPVEVSRRDGFGSLINQNAGQTYKLTYTVAGSADVYSTAPGTLPKVRVRATLEAFTPPGLALGRSVGASEPAPPAHGSVMQWRRMIYNISAGDNTIKLPHVGNHIREILFLLRVSGARSTTNLPDSLTLKVDGNVLDTVSLDVIRHSMAEVTGFDGAEDAASGLDKGVVCFDWAHDLDGKIGHETRHGYLPTTSATDLDLEGSFGAAGVLTVLTNDVAIAPATPTE